MRVTTDDDLRRVDSRWLGVPGWTFPWRPTRYIAYVVGAPIVVVAVLLSTRLFGTSLWPLVYGAAAGIAITTYLMRLVDDERPVSDIAPLIWAELGTPRTGRHAAAVEEQIILKIPVFTITAGSSARLLIRGKPRQRNPFVRSRKKD